MARPPRGHTPLRLRVSRERSRRPQAGASRRDDRARAPSDPPRRARRDARCPLLRARPNATPVSRPTSPVRSLPFPSHAQLFNCGQVCKAWHDDAMDVLMRDTAVSGRGARRFPRAPSRSPNVPGEATTTPPPPRGAPGTKRAPRRTPNSTSAARNDEGRRRRTTEVPPPRPRGETREPRAAAAAEAAPPRRRLRSARRPRSRTKTKRGEA